MRRAVLLSIGATLVGIIGGAVLVLAQAPATAPPREAQAVAEVGPAPATNRPAPEPPEPSPMAEPAPTLAPAAPFEPDPADVYPNAKRLAGRVAQRLTTYPPGSTPQGVAEALVGESGGDVEALAAAAEDLVHPAAASSGAVVYAQLGGVTPRAASVMVVTRQETIDGDGDAASVTRTLDIRLRLEGDSWTFDHVASDGGPPEPRPDDLSPAAAAVVDHPGVDLPDSAKWDTYRGEIDERLLELMLAIADRQRIGVVVLSTGHPWEVFGTQRQSDHTRGGAVDVYAVDGELVVAQRADGTPAHELSRWLFDSGVPGLGSPWAFDGFGGRSFTDVVHQDHLHVAVGRAP